MTHRILKFLMLATSLTGVFHGNESRAAAFQLRETNASILGHAHAGSAALTGDVGTMFNNPASMTYLKKHAVAFSATAIAPTFRFQSDSSTKPTLGLGAPAVNNTGNNGGNGGSLSLVPAFYVMWNATDDLKIGLNLTVPFGLKTDYNPDWIGRYYAIRSDLKTYNINPSIAYRLNEYVSIGAGLSAQRAEATLSSAVYDPLNAVDAIAKVSGNSWGWGGNLGVLVEPRKGTRVGLAWRSQIKHNIDGNVNYQNLANINAMIRGYLADEGAKAKTTFTLPETVTLSLSHDITPAWTLLADVQWTHWARLNELRIRFPQSAGVSDKLTIFKYKDSWFFALGARHQVNDNWTAKVGFAYDKTPTVDGHRDPRIPDSNRYWVSTGIECQATDNLKFSMDYTYIFMEKAKINPELQAIDKTGTLVGRFKSDTHILGMRLLWKL